MGTVIINFENPSNQTNGSVSIEFKNGDTVRNVIERVINNFPEEYQDADHYSQVDD